MRRMQRIHRSKYCGRLWQAWKQRISALSTDRLRLCQRTRLSFSVARDFGYFEEMDYRRLARRVVAVNKNADIVASESTKRTPYGL